MVNVDQLFLCLLTLEKLVVKFEELEQYLTKELFKNEASILTN
jgi:hypothetical protein